MPSFELTVCDGPNLVSRHSIVRLSLKDGETGEVDTRALLAAVKALNLRQSAPLPAEEQLATRLGAEDRIARPDAIGHLCLVLQDDRFPETLSYHLIPTSKDMPDICVETIEPNVGRVAVLFANRLVLAAMATGKPLSADGLAQEAMKFMEARHRLRMTENTRLLVEAARDRDIPCRLAARRDLPVTFGYGRLRNRMFETLADSSSAVATQILSRDKRQTAALLSSMGLPVPRQRAIADRPSLKAAVDAIGFPLVVKGSMGKGGTGVTADIRSEEALEEALGKVPKENYPILIEAFVEGIDHHLFVVGGRMAAAVRRVPAHVIGDGESTIRQLVRADNIKRRSDRYGYWLTPLAIDPDSCECLSEQGLDPGSVPEKDRFVRLRHTDDLGAGGVCEDISDLVHPDVVDAAERAAVYAGLELAGVDIMTPDIGKPLSETGGTILEVNCIPSLRPYYATLKPCSLAGVIVDHLFQDKAKGRIPIAAVTGIAATQNTCALISRVLTRSGRTVGMVGETDAQIAGRPIGAPNTDRATFTHAVLSDTIVDAAVLCVDNEDVVSNGLGFDKCSVAVVTALAPTEGEAAPVEQILANAAYEALVLNADDHGAETLARETTAPIWWVGTDRSQVRLAEHRRCGGHAILIADDGSRTCLIACTAEDETVIMPVADIAAVSGEPRDDTIKAAAFAAAASLAMGHDIDTVRKGLAADGPVLKESAAP